MNKPRKTYSVEAQGSFVGEGWHPIMTGATRGFARGYLCRHRESPGPKLAMLINEREAQRAARRSARGEL